DGLEDVPLAGHCGALGRTEGAPHGAGGTERQQQPGPRGDDGRRHPFHSAHTHPLHRGATMVRRRHRNDRTEGVTRQVTSEKHALRFGYSTINWGTTPDLDAVFDEIRQAGWGAVELFVHPLDWLGTPVHLRKKLGGLQVATNFGA